MSGLSDQERLEMLRRAAGAERRNSPRSLVFLAVVVLLVAGVYAGLGWTGRSGSLKSFRAAQRSQDLVRVQLDELDALRSPSSADVVQVHERLVSPVTLLQQAAEKVEIAKPEYDSERSESDSGSTHRRIIRFKPMRLESAGDALRWAQQVEDDIPGMRVYSMDFNAARDRRGWDVTVQFSRLEKKQ